MSIFIQTDVLAFEPCAHGDTLNGECYDCFGRGEFPVDLSWLATLVHNLAIAGALTESWQLGNEYGSSPRMMRDLEWSPGCGKEADV